MSHPEKSPRPPLRSRDFPDTISQASQGTIKSAVKVSALARVAIISACIGGFGAGWYGMLTLFFLLLILETGLSFVLGRYVLKRLDEIDLARRFDHCSVSGRCAILETVNARARLLQEDIRKEREGYAITLSQSSAPRVREILFEVEESFRRHSPQV